MSTNDSLLYAAVVLEFVAHRDTLHGTVICDHIDSEIYVTLNGKVHGYDRDLMVHSSATC